MRLQYRLGLMASGFALLAYAQQGQVAGPVTGYVFDGAARAVRPVLGIPGASVFGDALPFGYTLGSASISPRSDSAVIMASDGSLHLVRLSGGTATEIQLNGASTMPERVVYSPSGTAVALLAAGRAQVFSGLPASPTLAATMELGSAGPAQVQAESARRTAANRSSVALSDDGAWLLAAGSGTVQLIGPGGSHTVANSGRGALVAFAPAGHDAAIADPVARTLTLVRDVSGTATQQVVLQNDSAWAGDPVGVAFSADGKTLSAAGKAGWAVMVDLAAGTHTSAGCGCTLSGLEPMGSVYRLNEAGSGPLWLLDPAAGTPRIVFVPAPTKSE